MIQSENSSKQLIESTNANKPFFLFFSDNGGHLNANPKSRYPKTVEKARKVGLNTPLRGQKGQKFVEEELGPQRS